MKFFSYMYNFTFAALKPALATSHKRSDLSIQKLEAVLIYNCIELFSFCPYIWILSRDHSPFKRGWMDWFLSQENMQLLTYRHVSVDMIWGEELWAEWGLAHPRTTQHQHPAKYWNLGQTANWRISIRVSITYRRHIFQSIRGLEMATFPSTFSHDGILGLAAWLGVRGHVHIVYLYSIQLRTVRRPEVAYPLPVHLYRKSLVPTLIPETGRGVGGPFHPLLWI
jgi:hypothetical protein